MVKNIKKNSFKYFSLPNGLVDLAGDRVHQAFVLSFPDNQGMVLVTVGVNEMNIKRSINIHRLYSVRILFQKTSI